MFKGMFEATIDAKGRTSMPAKFREVLVEVYGDERFVITNSSPVDLGGGAFSNGLLIFPYKKWLEFEENFRNTKGLTSAQRNSIMRTIISPAEECVADKLGRLLVPSHMRKSAALEREVLFVGVMDKIEVWSQAEREKVRVQDMKNFPSDSETVAELGL
jgi:MraZ protein